LKDSNKIQGIVITYKSRYTTGTRWVNTAKPEMLRSRD